MSVSWSSESLVNFSRLWQQFCVLAAAVKLDLFTAVGPRGNSAMRIADIIHGDTRGTTILLDALTALNLLTKNGDQYSVPEGLYALLSKGPDSVLPLLQHQVNLMPRWLALPEVVHSGKPYTEQKGYEAPPAALESFIEAMHTLAAPHAESLVRTVPAKGAAKLLDVGGGPGTFTIAFLKTNRNLTAVVFDRPEVIPIAREHVTAAHLGDRVEFIGGDFYTEELPSGCDLAWVSAIIHMNSRQQNRELFAKVLRALTPGGRIVIRDHVMDESRTSPPSGAMFAINMLVSTAGGGTYTFDEIRHDLQQAGFGEIELLSDRAEMNCLVSARKPA